MCVLRRQTTRHTHFCFHIILKQAGDDTHDALNASGIRMEAALAVTDRAFVPLCASLATHRTAFYASTTRQHPADYTRGGAVADWIRH